MKSIESVGHKNQPEKLQNKNAETVNILMYDNQRYTRNTSDVPFYRQAHKRAMERSKINKTVGVHGLRHSYATHLLERGTDMYFIQKLLGHRNLKTTEIYAKVSNRQLGNVKSPLDDL